jgi:3-deoxy-7-phosphoheptulonate synthase
VVSYIENNGLSTHLSAGEEVTIIGIVGDKTKLPTENLISFKDVDRIVPVTETYKLANRKFHPEPSRIQVGNTWIGPGSLSIMAGPCAVESEEQLMRIARAVKKSGASILRGGAYKPRTTPSRDLRKKGCVTCRPPAGKPDLRPFVKLFARKPSMLP